MNERRVELAGFAMACTGGLSGIATLMASGSLGGTYARVLVATITLCAVICVVSALTGSLLRARNTAGLMLWLILGAAFAHATEPGTAVGDALVGIATLVPAGGLAVLAIASASGRRTADVATRALSDSR